MTTPPTLPAWVTEADGRLVPFEPERVVRALFAAGERLGRPDVFLARELTDGALLFLAENLDESPPAAREVAELVAKVVRELGHPALARAYLEVAAGGDPPGERAATSLSPAAGLPEWLCGGRGPEAVRDRAAGEFLRAVSLEEVFPPELVAAHRGGLLNLGGLEAPLELAGHVLPAVPPPGENGCGLLEAVHAARAVVGGALAIDAPEYALAQGEADPARSAAGFARELFFALCGTGLRAVVNLNPAAPPGWAGGWEGGPLFRPVGPPSADRLRAARAALLRELTAPGPAGLPPGALRVAWHVSERGFQPGRQGELREAVRLALERRPVDFHLDRPRRPVFLGDGLERERPSVLMEVGLCLNWLAGQVAQGGPDPALFLRKLGSLVRLAKSAGHARQEFLRRAGRPELRSGFTLERARLLLKPLGVGAAVRALLGSLPPAGGAALELGRRILAEVREAAAQDRRRSLEFGLVVPAGEEWVASDPRRQVRVAAALHAEAPGALAELVLTGDPEACAGEAFDLLRECWAADLGRVRLALVPATA